MRRELVAKGRARNWLGRVEGNEGSSDYKSREDHNSEESGALGVEFVSLFLGIKKEREDGEGKGHDYPRGDEHAVEEHRL